jgi:hypothetical protein
MVIPLYRHPHSSVEKAKKKRRSTKKGEAHLASLQDPAIHQSKVFAPVRQKNG